MTDQTKEIEKLRAEHAEAMKLLEHFSHGEPWTPSQITQRREAIEATCALLAKMDGAK